ncbi:MAG: DUF2188 domain-containing protein [Caulobacteraceae bacterium]
MDHLTYYVIRQRGGWGVEHGGMVRSGHKSRESAIATARAHAAKASHRGHDCCLRIQEDAGSWREERSFAPKD